MGEENSIIQGNGKNGNLGGNYHPLGLAKISDELSAYLKNQWIQNIEQAVAYLASCSLEIEGKKAFLEQARIILGEEAFIKYSTPTERHPLGCKEAPAKEPSLKCQDELHKEK